MPDTKQGSAAAAPAAATPEPLAAILAEMRDEPSPRPWRVEENVVGWSSFIVDANGDGVAACWRTARGDDEKERQYSEANARLIVDAVNERDELKAECDRLRTAYADLWRAVKRIEADSRLSLGTGLEVASCALHCVHTYALSAIRAAEKKGLAP